ncbi:unnamed protein product [Owenia fusiformis]|uniref:Uncharacterized protein n=1 Tax=Owenia fusiformis TaxID=6347 RepID=A0A8J1XXK5_OWEFU|nr:unnamed protein product [Owenia fusiformis]
MCSLCLFILSQNLFEKNKNLSRHLLTYDDNAFHVWHICGMKLKSSTQLTRHIPTHSKHKPHVCKEFGKANSDSDVLVCHMKVHSRPFICNIMWKDIWTQ